MNVNMLVACTVVLYTMASYCENLCVVFTMLLQPTYNIQLRSTECWQYSVYNQKKKIPLCLVQDIVSKKLIFDFNQGIKVLLSPGKTIIDNRFLIRTLLHSNWQEIYQSGPSWFSVFHQPNHLLLAHEQ